MRDVVSVLVALLFFAFPTTTIAAGHTEAVQTMAGILFDFKHAPTDSDKATLKAMLQDEETTPHERVVAQALLNLQHQVSAEDKPKLQALLKDGAVPAPVKTLAAVVLDLDHTPTEFDKEDLFRLLR